MVNADGWMDGSLVDQNSSGSYTCFNSIYLTVISLCSAAYLFELISSKDLAACSVSILKKSKYDLTNLFVSMATELPDADGSSTPFNNVCV